MHVKSLVGIYSIGIFSVQYQYQYQIIIILATPLSQMATFQGAQWQIVRAVAPSLVGPAMARPVLAAGTKILNIQDMHFKHTFKLGGGGGGYWPKVKKL